jgi:hypothetical protein
MKNGLISNAVTRRDAKGWQLPIKPNWHRSPPLGQGNLSLVAGSVTMSATEPWQRTVRAVRLSIATTVTVAGATIEVALYDCDNDWLPRKPIIDLGTIDASSTGTKTIDRPMVFGPGPIYLAMRPSVTGLSVGSITGLGDYFHIPFRTAGQPGTSNNVSYSWDFTSAFGSEWPQIPNLTDGSLGHKNGSLRYQFQFGGEA